MSVNELKNLNQDDQEKIIRKAKRDIVRLKRIYGKEPLLYIKNNIEAKTLLLEILTK